MLLGEPQQLEQPQQGTHPEGTDASALEHILQGHKTIPDDRGIFLPRPVALRRASAPSRRKSFTKQNFVPAPDWKIRCLLEPAPFEGSGLWVVSATHQGNQNSSPEEVEVIDKTLARLLQPRHAVD